MYLPKPRESENRTQLTQKQKHEQLQRKIAEQLGLCYYCRRPMMMFGKYVATREHLVPQPAGCAKDDSDSNVVAACWSCNFDKGSKRL